MLGTAALAPGDRGAFGSTMRAAMICRRRRWRAVVAIQWEIVSDLPARVRRVFAPNPVMAADIEAETQGTWVTLLYRQAVPHTMLPCTNGV
ncbi:hypothetical protein [Streptomyces sp. NPDC002133]|uniref:hypothetical protein n=1 Tax=Streptomyces sp. NPDC002133 TaxID=3154409 RepID=UPI003330E69B